MIDCPFNFFGKKKFFIAQLIFPYMFYGIKLIQDNRNKGKIRWSYIYLPSFFSIFPHFFAKTRWGVRCGVAEPLVESAYGASVWHLVIQAAILIINAQRVLMFWEPYGITVPLAVYPAGLLRRGIPNGSATPQHTPQRAYDGIMWGKLRACGGDLSCQRPVEMSPVCVQ